MRTNRLLLMILLVCLIGAMVFAGGGGEDPPDDDHGWTGNYDIRKTKTSTTSVYIRLSGTWFRTKVATAQMVIDYIVTGYAVDNYATTASIWSSTFVRKGVVPLAPALVVQEYGASRTTASTALHRWEWPLFFAHPGATSTSHTLVNQLSSGSIIGTRVTY